MMIPEGEAGWNQTGVTETVYITHLQPGLNRDGGHNHLPHIQDNSYVTLDAEPIALTKYRRPTQMLLYAFKLNIDQEIKE